mgnify:CR=1 FL=1
MNGQTASRPPPVGTHATDPRLCPVLRRFVRRRQAFHLAIAGHRRAEEHPTQEPLP